MCSTSGTDARRTPLARISRRFVRRLLIVTAALAAAAVGAWVLVFVRPWDPHMDAAAAARALQAKVGGGPFDCHRTENDGSIVGMSDVDYLCSSTQRGDSGYWIGTSGDRVTEIQPTG